MKIEEAEKHEDKRGWLVEILRRDKIQEDIKQIYFSITVPGAVRGNHYHKRKVEWFCVLKGVARLLMEDNNTKERKELILYGDCPKVVKIPPNVTHAIENIGDEDMYLMVIANEVFDPRDPDTYYKIII